MGKKQVFKSSKQLLLTTIAALALLGTGSVINTVAQDGNVVRAANTTASSDSSLMVTRNIVVRTSFDGVPKNITINNVRAIPDGSIPAQVLAPKFAGYTTQWDSQSKPMEIYLFGPDTTYEGKSYEISNTILNYVSPTYDPYQAYVPDPELGDKSGYIHNQHANVTYTIPSAIDGQVYNISKYGQATATSQKLAKGSKWKISQVLTTPGEFWVNAGKNAWLKLKNKSYISGSAWMSDYDRVYTAVYPVSTITRNGGAHVYSTVNNNLVATSRVLPKGSSWATKLGTTHAHGDWFNIGGDQWLRSSDVTNHPKAATSTPSNKPATKIKINYVPGYSIRVWKFDANHKATMTSKSLKHGTTWRVLGGEKINGVISWYNLGGNQWIQAKYAVAVK